jgi:hypothetical protein
MNDQLFNRQDDLPHARLGVAPGLLSKWDPALYAGKGQTCAFKVRIKTTKGLFLIPLAVTGVFGGTTRVYGNGCQVQTALLLCGMQCARSPDLLFKWACVAEILRGEAQMPGVFL